MSTSDHSKPIIIGLYGISGCGKSYLLNQLKADSTLKDRRFAFYDGSELIDKVTPGGLDVFKQLKRAEKDRRIEAALSKVSKDCQDRQETAVITGHYFFYNPEMKPKISVASIDKDWETYTHIIYLDVNPGIVAGRRLADTSRVRTELSVKDLAEWQQVERINLRRKCREKDILYVGLPVENSSHDSVTLLQLKAVLQDFQEHTETSNMAAIDEALETALSYQGGVEKVLLLDGDKTLAPYDTGAMFWNSLGGDPYDPLKKLFDSKGYSYASFRQATLLYEEMASMFDTLCDKVASQVDMYPEMIALLNSVAKEPHVRAVIVTCGLRPVWKKVLKRNGLSHVNVIGGGRIGNGYVVTDQVKGHIVDKLHEKKLRVLAFGDSPLDLEMLTKADAGYVVVGDKATRSKSMDAELAKAIDKGLSVRQIILPATAEPRIDLTELPQYELSDANINLMLRRSFIHATDKNVSKLLQTPTRDKTIAGHDLRKAHERIGYYLATEFLSDLLGVEQYNILHVQGHTTDGYRYKDETDTLIVPLMRGGEPMAFGVSKALKTASFAHAKDYSDIKKGLLKGKRTIILVDSVVNSGSSIMQFMAPLREELPEVRVVVIAGVVQANAVVDTAFAKLLNNDPNLTLVALRKSDNAFKGKGATDTGDRLFNTTYLDD